jgi:hypothetical protein
MICYCIGVFWAAGLASTQIGGAGNPLRTSFLSRRIGLKKQSDRSILRTPKCTPNQRKLGASSLPEKVLSNKAERLNDTVPKGSAQSGKL